MDQTIKPKGVVILF